MARVENSDIDTRKHLNSEDPSERSAAVASLMDEELDDVTTEMVCALVEDHDNGVRNAVDMTLSGNSSSQIPKFLVKYISSPSIATRNLAGEILIKIGSRAVDAILEYIDGGNDDDKKFLIDVLGLIGDKRPSRHILELMQVCKNDNVVLACAEALGSLGYVESLDTLLQFYEKNELYKPTIIEAFGRIGTKKALNFITSRYNEEDELTKFSMIESLGSVGDEESFFFLVSELQTTTGPIVWPIVNSIYLLKGKYNLDIPFDEKMKNALLQTVGCADEKYKASAVHLITAFDDEETILTCIKVYGDNIELDEIVKPKILSHPHILFSAFPDFVDSRSGNISSLLELIKEFSDNDRNVFANSLSNIQKRNLADAFTKSLDNPDEEARRLAIELLFTIDQGTAMLFIDKMVEDDNLWNRLKLLEILGEVNSMEANTVLKRMVDDAEEMVSERAKYILSQRPALQLENENRK